MPRPLGIGLKQPKFMLAPCISTVNPLIDNGEGSRSINCEKLLAESPQLMQRATRSGCLPSAATCTPLQ